MIARPFLAVLVALAAFSLQGHFDCRDSAACEVTVTHNEVLQ
ncbi:hypothetical protein AB9U01_25270 [Pseudomonas qingdaonensis]